MVTSALKVCGTGVGNWPQPGDPDNNSILRATPAFGGIDVTWTMPTAFPQAVAYVNLLHSLSPTPGSATYLVSPSGNFYYDKRNDAEMHYYWIEIVSVNGTKGDWIGPASARAKPMIAEVIEQLTDKIDRGVLAQSLKADLDKISLLNTHLLEEIKAREDANTSLAQALADASRGVAQALNFIHTEINSRVEGDAAMAERIDLVASTSGGDYAAVIQTMRTNIDSLDSNLFTARTDIDYLGDRSTRMGALWTAQVNVNGLIGGFGVFNDGQFVEAGFDVDLFWIGRTNANKRKPFIIQDGVTYLDDAVIRQLVFSKLRDEGGSFIVENGKIRADYITIGFAQIKSANIEDLSVSRLKIADEAVNTGKIEPGAVTVAAFAQSPDRFVHTYAGQGGHIYINNLDSGGGLLVFDLAASGSIEISTKSTVSTDGGE